jgi:hypothetical protein
VNWTMTSLCVLSIDQLTREHGQHTFYVIEQGGDIQDLIQSPHLFLVQDSIAIHDVRMDKTSMDASKYDEFEKD